LDVELDLVFQFYIRPLLTKELLQLCHEYANPNRHGYRSP